ncbi:hypothetical protein TSUD_333300 [Trifolium subterraneum]|uniref:RRM domain-containing protein n=1 Tax=Trifolium subterraneum TaxID=3900 RepID=A0A2Z6MG83_TRISU|nr:hypothetical protein TSUD_333300 [Trifolium subterraneum]
MSKKKEMEDLEKNNGDFVSKEEEIRVFIKSLSKPQLVDLLSQIGSKYPSIAEEIQSFANVDRARRKLNAFKVHGEIEEGNVMLDRDTGKSAQRSKFFDELCKFAHTGLTKTISSATNLSQRNLYIENLSPQVTSEILFNYFKRHGDMEECILAFQRHKDLTESRSGFVTYKTAEAAKNAIKDLDQTTLEGTTITVKYFDFHNDGGGQPSSVPARVAPTAALHMTPEYVEGYTYPRPATPYVAPPYPYPQTGSPYAASPYPYSQTDAPHATPPYPYPRTAAPPYPYPRIAVPPYPYPQTDAPHATPPYPYPRTAVPPYPYPRTAAPYAASPYRTL